MTPLTESHYTTAQRFVSKMWTRVKYLVLICTTLFLTSQGVNYGHDVNPPGHNHTPYFVNEQGEYIIGSPGVFVLENLPNHLIGNVGAIDEDGDDTLTYSLAYDRMYYHFTPGHKHHLQPYGHYYTINSETGEVRTGSNGLDFEELPYTYFAPYKYHTVVVTVEDGKGGSEWFIYQVFVTDVDENGNQPSDTTSPVPTPQESRDENENQPSGATNLVPTPQGARIVLSSTVAQHRIIFNEIRNASDDTDDWLEIRNISDEEVALIDWEISIVIQSETKMARNSSDVGKDDVDIVVFPDYTLPAGGILLIVNTDPSETDLIGGQDITDEGSDTDTPPQYLIASDMKLPDVPYMLILRSSRDENGKPEDLEDMTGNYFRSFVDYNTQVWPLVRTVRPSTPEAALLTRGQAWQRVDVEARGYIKDAWALSRHQSGLGYKPKTPVEMSLGTPGYPNDTVVDMSLAGRITFSELMYATNGGLFSQPQWIELYNNTGTAAAPVNLEGWKLVIEARDSQTRHRHSEIALEALEIASTETALLVTRNRRHSGHLSEDQVYDLYEHHSGASSLGLRENVVLSASGFSLRLYSPDGVLVDSVGNLDGEKGVDTPLWELPSGWTEDGARTSLLRGYEDEVALLGTESTNWYRATDVDFPLELYYGHKTDLGTPGYMGGGVAPVMLSHFRSERTDSGVIIAWTTASEIDNAGFNILRSETKSGRFVKVNPTLIFGAGTTSEQNTYTWTDTTARPNVGYYFQLEDVSFSGHYRRIATVHMRGFVSASGKLTTMWADLKTPK